jgi:hypothetical protein
MCWDLNAHRRNALTHCNLWNLAPGTTPCCITLLELDLIDTELILMLHFPKASVAVATTLTGQPYLQCMHKPLLLLVHFETFPWCLLVRLLTLGALYAGLGILPPCFFFPSFPNSINGLSEVFSNCKSSSRRKLMRKCQKPRPACALQLHTHRRAHLHN